jgi:hypothetical protein
MTNALAIYGAVIGTVAAVTAAISICKNRPIIQLKLSQLMPADSFPHWCLAITAINHGWRAATLDGGGLEYEDGWTLVLPPERLAMFFPAELKEGKNHMIWFTVDELREALRNGEHGALKYGFFTTATRQRYRKRLNPASPLMKRAMSETRNAQE